MYKYIVAWGRLLGSYPYYIKEQVARAKEEGAPQDATHYSVDEERWMTVEDISNPVTKDLVEKWAAVIEQGGS